MIDDKKGLLGFIATPEGQGLLAAVFGGLAGARHGQPLNSIGMAGMSGLMGYGNALDRNAQAGRYAQAQAFQKMQMDRWNRQGAIDDQVAALAPKYFTPGTPGVEGGIPGDAGPMPPVAATPARFDAQGYGNALMGVAPEKGAAWLQAMQKEDAPINVAPGGTVFDPRTNQPVFTAPFAPKEQNPNQPFSLGADGAIVPNVLYQDYQRSLKPAPTAPAPRNIDPAILAREKFEWEKKNQPSSGVDGKPMTKWQETQYRNKIADDYKATGALINTVDDVKKAGAELKGHKGLKGITGLQGYLPSNPYGDAANAEVKLNNLKGKVTSMGKAIMAASGAIGPMAIQEWKIVSDAVAALDPRTADAKSIQDQIDIVNATAERMSVLGRESYSKQYGEDFERYPQFRELPKSRLGSDSAGAKPAATMRWNPQTRKLDQVK